MKDHTFTMAMGKIIAEAEAEQAAEVRAQHRRRILTRVRGVISFLMVVGMLVAAFCYRGKLQSLLMPKTAATQTSNGSSASIKSAQDSAAARDKALNEISK
jgi:hypothetical protein